MGDNFAITSSPSGVREQKQNVQERDRIQAKREAKSQLVITVRVSSRAETCTILSIPSLSTLYHRPKLFTASHQPSPKNNQEINSQLATPSRRESDKADRLGYPFCRQKLLTPKNPCCRPTATNRKDISPSL
jgi:hypothetical protein